MKLIHHITLTVFAKPEEDVPIIRDALIKLVPFDLEENKVKVECENTVSFNERVIKVYKIKISKTKLTHLFLSFLKDKLGKKQTKTIFNQRESRLDQEDVEFFIRIGKDKWIADNEMILTDSGFCFHIKILLAAYPANRQNGLKIIEKIFG